MKLLKIRMWMAINGLLTLSSLIMLFFGLCRQVDKSEDLFAREQSMTMNSNTDLVIAGSVMSLIVFGVAFFASWIKTRKAQAHAMRHHAHHA
ncbi:hypothetical protein OZX56_08475 [Lactobacillus sp. ESL0684]|uniref:hypothetical protein n=1 Tax=unclassified Lactobacillus TaxID=2620435 RepID=UPI0023F8F7C3|nr:MULTISPECIES: hypothetical protein [unclassified Lactobacillus]WEV39934.1 hypothetical protein OZX59_06900 [Lactobacillus sp. ESL0681]WEV43523.1 hypothetical protein OZX56_08475 [Lactobacillus sp. ESL0684]